MYNKFPLFSPLEILGKGAYVPWKFIFSPFILTNIDFPEINVDKNVSNKIFCKKDLAKFLLLPWKTNRSRGWRVIISGTQKNRGISWTNAREMTFFMDIYEFDDTVRHNTTLLHRWLSPTSIIPRRTHLYGSVHTNGTGRRGWCLLSRMNTGRGCRILVRIFVPVGVESKAKHIFIVAIRRRTFNA